MKEYTIEDLEFKPTKKAERDWNYIKQEYEYKDIDSLDVSTKDGVYSSITDSDGFSYWVENKGNIRLGRTSYDYFFICKNSQTVIKDQQSMVDLLNRLK